MTNSELIQKLEWNMIPRTERKGKRIFNRREQEWMQHFLKR